MSDEIDYPTICIIDFDDVRDMILGPWVCQLASTLEKGQPRDTEPGVGHGEPDRGPSVSIGNHSSVSHAWSKTDPS